MSPRARSNSEAWSSAPGKLMLTGEYAVLRGAPALVMAVNRRVTASLATAPLLYPSPFLRALTLRQPTPEARFFASKITVDSKAFYHDSKKLGLGSSAAVCVAAVGLLHHLMERPTDPATVYEIAAALHGDVQAQKGARGSGADVAASAYGGAIGFCRSDTELPTVTPLAWPSDAAIVAFYVGASADTVSLVTAVNDAAKRAPGAVEAALERIAAASQATIAGLASTSAFIAGLRAAEAAISALATATDLAIVPPMIAELRPLVHALGGAVKTTGAGAGDLAVAILPAAADRSQLIDKITLLGGTPVPLEPDAAGIEVHA